MAAGTLLVEEAGGRVSDMTGARHDVSTSPHLLADNGAVHDDALQLISRIFAGEYPVPLPEIC
jgi:myo-inositol-1(or 4)-monophosphatase